MEWRQWRQQWDRLERLESELATAAAPPLARQREQETPGLSAPQLSRAQLTRHLGALEALRTAGGDLPRRRQQCWAVQAALESACAADHVQLAPQEQQAAAEWDTAARLVQQLLQAAPRALGEENSGDGSASGRIRSASTISAVATDAAATATEQSPEVTALDTFLQRHGPTGGWHADDHAEFERILRACRGNYQHCVRLACQELGLLHSEVDVLMHASWHEELRRLQQAKRLAVQRWRQQRQADQAALLERHQAEAAAAQEAAALAEKAAALQAAAQQKERQRMAVQEWRAAREQQAAEAAQRQEAEEQERRQREQQARQVRQQENREQLEQRQREKAVAAKTGAAPCAESSCSSRASTSTVVDPAARQRLQERNAQLLARRAQQVQARSAAAAAAVKRVEALASRASEQFAGAAERDPGRLLQPTATAALRQLAALSEEHAPRHSGFIRHLPRRATPTWCSGARLQ